MIAFTNSQLLVSSAGLNIVGSVFCMTVDPAHNHEQSSIESSSSSISSVCTLSTFIEELTLTHKLSKAQPTRPKKNIAHWSKSQISMLVGLLRKYGSDFTTIAPLVGKSREQVKRKFKVLERKHPHLAEAIFERDSSIDSMIVQPEIELEENDFFN